MHVTAVYINTTHTGKSIILKSDQNVGKFAPFKTFAHPAVPAIIKRTPIYLSQDMIYLFKFMLIAHV